VSIISFILRAISTGQPCELDMNEMIIDNGTPLMRAIRGQEKIGWKAMCQGFVHKDWAITQRDHYRKLGTRTKYCNVGRWRRMFCTILSTYCLECWNKRNETLHGKTHPESRAKKLVRLRKQVKALYQCKGMVKRIGNKRIFDMPLKKGLQWACIQQCFG
jgi:hypothetical protein